MDNFWQRECSKLRFGLSGEISPNLNAWADAIFVHGKNWYWAYEWMLSGYPSPPDWFYKDRETYLNALGSN